MENLIICLCLGSLIILPMTNSMGLSIVEIKDIDFENTSQFEQTDLNEDYLVGSFTDPTLAGLLSFRPGSTQLHNPSSSLPPDSPPPEFA